MTVSFKVSKFGRRFRPRSLRSEDSGDNISQKSDSKEPSVAVTSAGLREADRKPEGERLQAGEARDDVPGNSGSSISSLGVNGSSGNEVSFIINLFADGYSVIKFSENQETEAALIHDTSKFLRPYDRASETFFSAIESGRLPGHIMDDIPCKYIDGTLVCEVRDYRCRLDPGNVVSSAAQNPLIKKVCLRTSSENVVKDISLISNDSWAYGDLMEVESRILQTMRPKLCLDPTPKLDQLCKNPALIDLNLDIRGMRRKRLREIPEITVTACNKSHGKKVSIDRMPDGPDGPNARPDDIAALANDMGRQSRQGSMTARTVIESSVFTLNPNSFAHLETKSQIGTGILKDLKEYGSVSALNTLPSAVPGSAITLHGTISSIPSPHGKRAYEDMQHSVTSSLSKRTRTLPTGTNNIQQQQTGMQIDPPSGSDLQWKNALSQFMIGKTLQDMNSGVPKYAMLEGVLNQESGMPFFSIGQNGIQNGSNQELLEAEMNQLNSYHPRFQQRLQENQFVRQSSFNSLDNYTEKGIKDDNLQRRKSVQSPHLSAGNVAQSPASHGEICTGPLCPQVSATAKMAAMEVLHKEKLSVPSFQMIGGTSSLSSFNELAHWQHQQATAKRRANSLPKASSVVGSPASVSNVGAPVNKCSPSIGAPPLVDQNLLDRFSKIEMVAKRYQLSKRSKPGDCVMRKQRTYSTQQLMFALSDAPHAEDIKGDTSAKLLSKSLAGGSVNTPKIRVLTFIPKEQITTENVPRLTSRECGRLILSEKWNDGTVAMHYGDMEVGDFLGYEDRLPTLPSTHMADLYASQFCSLMMRDGYVLDDNLQPKPRINFGTAQRVTAPAMHDNSASGTLPNTETRQVGSDVARAADSANQPITAPQNLPEHQRSQGNPQSLHMAGVSVPSRQHQMDVQQQNPSAGMQSQIPQPPKSSVMLPSQHVVGQSTNMQLGNKLTPLQIQMLQQHHQQHLQQTPSQQQLQRKIMMSLGMNNNMVGMGGIGGARVMGGMGQSQLNFAQQLRQGMITPTQAAIVASRLGLAPVRAALAGNPGISGVRQMNPASGPSMLGQTLNRANTSAVMRTQGCSMAPPRPMSGVDLYIQQQQLQQLQQHRQAGVCLQQEQQQTGSPQLQSQPQLSSQRVPVSPQLSSGAIPPSSGGNGIAGGPASPQLSSQTFGSVGSITNTSMDLQASNKCNSMANS